MNLGDAIGILASLLGGVASAYVATTLVYDWRRRSGGLKALRKADVKVVLADPDIDALGAVLRNDLGKVRVGDYSRDKATRDRFNDVIASILEFLGRDGDASKNESLGADDRAAAVAGATERVSPELRRAYDEVLHGEVWNGLARARRALEIEFRGIIAAREGQPSAKPYMSLGATLNWLLAARILDATDANQLRYALSVFNRAVHGDPVNDSDALEALVLANRVLLKIQESRVK